MLLCITADWAADLLHKEKKKKKKKKFQAMGLVPFKICFTNQGGVLKSKSLENVSKVFRESKN